MFLVPSRAFPVSTRFDFGRVVLFAALAPVFLAFVILRLRLCISRVFPASARFCSFIVVFGAFTTMGFVLLVTSLLGLGTLVSRSFATMTFALLAVFLL